MLARRVRVRKPVLLTPGSSEACSALVPRRKTPFQTRMEYFTLELVLGVRAYYQRRSSVTSDWAMARPATHVAKLSYILTMQ